MKHVSPAERKMLSLPLHPAWRNVWPSSSTLQNLIKSHQLNSSQEPTVIRFTNRPAAAAGMDSPLKTFLSDRKIFLLLHWQSSLLLLRMWKVEVKQETEQEETEAEDVSADMVGWQFFPEVRFQGWRMTEKRAAFKCVTEGGTSCWLLWFLIN